MMILGLLTDRENLDNKQARARIAEKTALFLKQFQSRFNTLLCRELTGFDLTDPEQLRQARATVFKTLCPGYIEGALQILTRTVDN